MGDLEHGIRARLTADLRWALNHLYDWPDLRHSPLLQLLGCERQADPARALKTVLLEAIESFRPDASVSTHARAQRAYLLLRTRFVEQFSQKETAVEMGMSLRNLRRAESQALGALADVLCARFQLDQPCPAPTTDVAPTETAEAAPPASPANEQEMNWLRASLPSEPTSADELLHQVLKLFRRTTWGASVQVTCQVRSGLPRLVVQRVPATQALLTVLVALAPFAKEQPLAIGVSLGAMYGVINCSLRHAGAGVAEKASEQLGMARQLLSLSGGLLHVASTGAEMDFSVTLRLPAEAGTPILFVDDNPDALRLLQQLVGQSRYRFVGTSCPDKVLDLAQEHNVTAIVLDVMLPSIDGWDLLGRLRTHPATQHLPVVICTVLPHESLASDFGASAFLHKPVTRNALLAVLERVTEMAPTPGD